MRSGRPSRWPATASPAIAVPFQSASTLSSVAGRCRRSRASSSFAASGSISARSASRAGAALARGDLERTGQVQDEGVVLEEGLAREAEERRQERGVLRSEGALDLAPRPDVVGALAAGGLGVDGAPEGTFRGGELAGEELRRGERDAARLGALRCARARARRTPAGGRCRRASSRSAAGAIRGRWRSGGSRRRAGPAGRRGPCRRGSRRASSRRRRARSRARPAARDWTASGTSAPRRSRPGGVEAPAQPLEGARGELAAGQLVAPRLELLEMVPDRAGELAPAPRPRRAARARRGPSRRARCGRPASPGGPPAGSRCPRRTARGAGVRNTEFGQPPWPERIWVASM